MDSMDKMEQIGPTGRTSSHISPVQQRHGTELLRGLEAVPRSTLYEGRFGRIFRELPPLDASEKDLSLLATIMFEPEREDDEEDTTLDNPLIPAGFTYLGQFVDHDITFDPTSKLQRQNDPD